MKKLFQYIILLTAAISFSSCSDFLEEENLGNATAAKYSTEQGYEGLVNSVYSTLRDVYQPTPYIFCIGTDLFFNAHQEVPVGLASYQSLNSGNSQVEYLFREAYESIQIANLALHYSDQTENFDNLDLRIAEVRAIRAFLYSKLLEHFGGVSLVTEYVDEPITHFERLPAEEIYDFVISEFEAVIPVLPDSQPDFGRMTKRAAQHFLAKVYLSRGYESFGTMDDFSMASSLADAAIAGQALTVSFEELFAYENDNNPEVLWSIQYSDASTQNGGAHNWDYPWGPLVTGSDDGVNKKNVLHPTEYLFTLFQDEDSRFEGTFLNIKATPYSGYRLDPGNTPISYYYPRTQQQINNVAAWRAEDPENRAETIISPIDPHWWDIVNQTDFPALKKYDRIQLSQDNIRYTHDLYLARLGETYLIAAEAYFQSNDMGNALARINEVRRRAATSGNEQEMQVNNIDLHFILDERARELAGEGFRWEDLKRTGTLMERTRMYNPDIKALYDSGVDPFLGPDGNHKILRPIPLSAIALDDGEYPQNPGYN